MDNNNNNNSNKEITVPLSLTLTSLVVCKKLVKYMHQQDCGFLSKMSG